MAYITGRGEGGDEESQFKDGRMQAEREREREREREVVGQSEQYSRTGQVAIDEAGEADSLTWHMPRGQ